MSYLKLGMTPSIGGFSCHPGPLEPQVYQILSMVFHNVILCFYQRTVGLVRRVCPCSFRTVSFI